MKLKWVTGKDNPADKLTRNRFYYQGKRKVFCRDKIFCQGKKYRLVFWFKDGTANHLWIRNCYLIDSK